MRDEHRVVVVGSGPTGAMAALRLVSKGIPVSLLESGQHFSRGLLLRAAGQTLLRYQPGLENGSGYITSADPRAHWYRYFSPGGLSNQWTGAVPRFASGDFSEGARLHEKYRWPIGYQDIAGYYEIVEGVLKVTGDPLDVPQLPAPTPRFPRRLPNDWRQIASRAETLGHGLTVLPIVDGGPWMFALQGTAFNSFTGIIRKLFCSRHFRFYPGAHAQRIEWEGSRNKASGVVYFDRKHKVQRHIAGDAIVVAAGPLASTRLLLNSKSSDFPHGLGNSAGLLGRYLHDHPKEWWAVDFDRPLSRSAYPAYISRSPYGDSQPLLAAQYVLGPTNTREKLLGVIPSKGTEVGVLVFGTMCPSSENYVSLHPSKSDDCDVPMLDLSIRYDDSVANNMVEARSRLLRLFDRAGYTGTIRKVVPQLEPGSSVHYGGTVRMHSSPEYGMLDGWNRLHEVPNVLVVDASSFTTGVEKNPTLTAMALAARAADRLVADLARK